MGLSWSEIQQVLLELGTLSGALLQEVYQPTPTELVLELRAGRESKLLLLSAHPHLSRLHVIAQRPPNPLKPFPFQMLCRKELGGRLVGLEQPGEDRVVRLIFQGAQSRALIAELTGRHSNIFLVDGTDQILGAMLPARGVARQLQPGRPYVALPPPPTPIRAKDRFATLPEGVTYQQQIEAFFIAEQRRLEREDLRGRLRTALRREQKRLDRRLSDLHDDLRKAEQAEQHRRYGDLLQIHLREIPRGRPFVVVPDDFSEAEDAQVEVPLDPQLDPVANVQRHYRLYRKYDASIPTVLERIEETGTELGRLGSLLERIDAAESVETLRALEREAGPVTRAKQTPPPARGRIEERRPYHRYLTTHGAEIWVGRGAKDNDALTFRVARGNDVWLHVRGRPGAHVVVPARGATPDLETLLDAACLALRHSGLPEGERAEVAWTRVKYVRRIPGAHPGLVTVTQDKTLYVEVSAQRLARLTRAE